MGRIQFQFPRSIRGHHLASLYVPLRVLRASVVKYFRRCSVESVPFFRGSQFTWRRLRQFRPSRRRARSGAGCLVRLLSRRGQRGHLLRHHSRAREQRAARDAIRQPRLTAAMPGEPWDRPAGQDNRNSACGDQRFSASTHLFFLRREKSKGPKSYNCHYSSSIIGTQAHQAK